MNRRSMLEALSAGLAAACSAAIAIPGMRYVFAAVQQREQSAATTTRLIRLRDLPVRRPVEANVPGSRRDAWTVYPAETIGRVWLVRQTEASVPESEARVEALSSICPHLGCAVQLGKEGMSFLCPCHKAQFDLAGRRIARGPGGEKNPAPRGMDGLDCRVVQDGSSGEWWVEVQYATFEQGLTAKVPKA